jgi:hypothetical protein
VLPSMANRSHVGRLVRWLADRSSGALFGMSLAWFVSWSFFVYLLLDELVSAPRKEELASVAGSLMGALGALFAFLTAFVITIEWGQHRDTEKTIGLEADSCVRLAWASESPGCDGVAIRGDLEEYLGSVLDEEWPVLADGGDRCETTHDRMTTLQMRVRQIAADPDVSLPVSSDLTTAADAVAVARTDRLNGAARDLPTPLFLLAFISGVMLALNAVVLALHVERGYGVAIGGLVVLIAVDLALLVAIASPFSGDLRVEGRPLARVLSDLEVGRYGPRRRLGQAALPR